MREQQHGSLRRYFDPQTFSGDSGGLLGRLQLQQGQYQPGNLSQLTVSLSSTRQ
jgi:hypothetical protein